MKSLFRFITSMPAVVVLSVMLTIILGGCTANTGAADERGLLPHLTVDLQLPTELTAEAIGQFRAVVEQAGEPVRTAQVTFELWSEDQTDEPVSVMAGAPSGNGLYTAEFIHNIEGVYRVRCRVTSGPLEVMPSKRFAIGEEAITRLAQLEQELQAVPGEVEPGANHHH